VKGFHRLKEDNKHRKKKKIGKNCSAYSMANCAQFGSKSHRFNRKPGA